VLQFDTAALLPGFDRLTGRSSAAFWIRTAETLIDSACFQSILKLEHECCARLDKWKRFAIAAKEPKDAKNEECQLFVQLTAACVSSGIPLIDPVLRAQALIRSITLTIKIQGAQVSVRELVLDRIGENQFGKAAVSRDLVFELYEHFFRSSSCHGVVSHGQAAPTNKQAVQPQAKHPVALTVTNTEGLATASTTPVTIVCRVCQVKFDEIPAEWLAKGRDMHMPKSCKACIAKRPKPVVMITAVDASHGMCGGMNFDVDPDDSDY
jgi:hypothetical protein